MPNSLVLGFFFLQPSPSLAAWLGRMVVAPAYCDPVTFGLLVPFLRSHHRNHKILFQIPTNPNRKRTREAAAATTTVEGDGGDRIEILRVGGDAIEMHSARGDKST